MVCLGLKPWAAGWKAKTNPLSYGGTPLLNTLIPLLESVTRSADISFVYLITLIWLEYIIPKNLWVVITKQNLVQVIFQN